MSMLRSTAVALLVLLAFAAPGLASAQVITEYPYEPNRIYPVRTGLGITTQIELDPNETILDYSTGFSSGWDITRRENVFYLKPKNVDVDTNMTIRTETHAYMFELKVVATDWRSLEQAKQAGVQYKIAFTYPNDTKFVDESESVPELSTQLDPNRVYNFNYDYATRTKNKWLIPSAVYDDGQFTYIKLSQMKGIPTGNFPAVYGRERRRSEDFVVNTTVENDTLIVHGIYPFLVLRHGDNVIGIRRSMQP